MPTRAIWRSPPVTRTIAGGRGPASPAHAVNDAESNMATNGARDPDAGMDECL